MVDVTAVTSENFNELLPFLAREGSSRITRAMWLRLVDNAWGTKEPCGYALFDQNKPVGFLATIHSKQQIAGVEHRICNLSTFVVESSHRNQSLRLLAPLASMKDITIVNLTPTADAYRLFRAIRFQPLEDGVYLLPPLPPRRPWARGVRVHFHRKAIADRLAPGLRRPFDDHPWPEVFHVLVEAGGSQLHVVYTRRSYRRIPFAHILYVSDPDMFSRTFDHFRAELALRARTPILMVDRRWFPTAPLVGVIRRNYPTGLLYRSRTLLPHQISSIYSELVLFPI